MQHHNVRNHKEKEDTNIHRTKYTEKSGKVCLIGISRDSNIKILKKAYDKGLITLPEYINSLKNYGVMTGKDAISSTCRTESTTSSNNIISQAKNATDNNTHISIGIKILDQKTENYAFMLRDGRTLQSLRDLMTSLDSMSNDTWAHHTKEGRNDFANWIRDVFDEEEIATIIHSKNTKDELKEFLKFLDK